MITHACRVIYLFYFFLPVTDLLIGGRDKHRPLNARRQQSIVVCVRLAADGEKTRLATHDDDDRVTSRCDTSRFTVHPLDHHHHHHHHHSPPSLPSIFSFGPSGTSGRTHNAFHTHSIHHSIGNSREIIIIKSLAPCHVFRFLPHATVLFIHV